MKDLTLVVMAAGMGSRFGGPKQITPIGPSGEFIIDYSIYDAIKAGFTKVIFIIKKEHKEIFDETITKRLQNKIKIEYAYQELKDIPKDVIFPEGRTKPWGTTHAILSAKNLIDGPFTIINADDFYGRDAYQKSIKFLTESTDNNEQAVISYPFNAVSSKFGSVKRAVLEIEENYVTELTESKVSIANDKAVCEPLDGEEPFTMELTHPVSMNLFCFKKDFLKLLEEDFEEFIHKDKDFIVKNESLVPDTVKKYLSKGDITLKNIVSSGTWAGITYKEDLPEVQNTINKLIDNGEYPSNLWNI